MQCVAGAAVAVGAASGIRAWIAAASPSWLTPTRLKAISFGLIALAVVASSLTFG